MLGNRTSRWLRLAAWVVGGLVTVLLLVLVAAGAGPAHRLEYRHARQTRQGSAAGAQHLPPLPRPPRPGARGGRRAHRDRRGITSDRVVHGRQSRRAARRDPGRAVLPHVLAG